MNGKIVKSDSMVDDSTLQTKTPSDPGKTENEGIQRILSKTVRQAGLILLFDGEVGRSTSDRDEHSQTGILTSASNLIPPSRSAARNSGFGNL